MASVDDTTGTPAGGPTEWLAVEVWRSLPEAQAVFHVDRSRLAVVLDVLITVQQKLDPTLAFRYSCRTATCGTCTIEVDGRPVLACRTPVPVAARRINLAPLRGLPVVRDLIVDTAPFFDAWKRVTPFVVPHAKDGDARSINAQERTLIDADRACITCAACFSSCSMTGADSDFLGPAALTRAMVLIADSRDSCREGRLDATAGVTGPAGCHYIGACTAVCPKGLDPARAIRRLRRWSARK